MTTSIRFKLTARACAGLLTVMLLCSTAFTVSAQSYYVATNGNDSANGTSWETPLLTISNAIAKASVGQTVAVSNGTYVLSTQLLLNKGITLQGFGGASNTIIDANASGRIMTISDANAVLDGFTLKNGRSATAINGTGVSMTGGTLRNCIISCCTNTATSGMIQGVGVYMTGGTLDTCTVEKNRASVNATINGGGLYATGVSCIVTNCLISDNYLGLDFGTSKGGGVYLSAGKLLASVVKNNTLQQGRYSGGGGGVFVTGSGTVSNCLVNGNAVTCVDVITRGGGIYVDWGTVVDCVVSNNSSQGYSPANGTFGGGVYMTGTSLVERCVITKNYQNNGWTSYRSGAGVACDGGIMRNCLIAGNTANTLGGGVYITAGSMLGCVVTNNTLSAERSGFGGGGLYVTGSGVAAASMPRAVWWWTVLSATTADRATLRLTAPLVAAYI